VDRTTFRRLHPEAAERSALFAFLLDAWDGTGGFAPPLDEVLHSVGGVWQPSLPGWKRISYLDRHIREDEQSYRERVRCAAYINLPRTVGETTLNFLWRRGPTRVVPSEDVQAFVADADGLGTSLDDVLREMSRRALLFGSCPALVDRSALPVRNKAEAVDAGAATYVTPLYPQSLADWEVDAAGNWQWIKLLDSTSRAESAETERVTALRARVWTPTNGHRWTMVENADPVDAGTWENPIGEVPLVVLRYAPSVGPTILGASPMAEIGNVSRDLFNDRSLWQAHIRRQVFAILAWPVSIGGDLQSLNLGTSNAAKVPADAPMPQYIAPPQSVSETLERKIQHDVAEAYRLARQEFLLSSSQAPTSGLARQYEFAHLNASLGAFARELARAERAMVRLYCLWHGLDVKVEMAGYEVSWPEDFDVRDLERELKIALDALMLPLGATARRVLVAQTRNAVVSLSDIDRQASDAELIEESQVGAVETPVES
jgi:hypothetical protein